MRNILIFEKGIHELQINCSSGFNYLNLVSANINKREYYKGIPSVEMILLNDKSMFTSYSNLIPGTNTLNCFDLLLTASNNPALVNEKYHTLKCVIPKTGIDESIKIELLFEFE